MDKKTILTVAVIIGGAMFLGLWIHGGYIAASRVQDVITVTGSTKRAVEADLGKWTANFSRRAGLTNVKQVIDQMKQDESKIIQFAVAEGLPLEAIKFMPVQTEQIFESSQYGYSQNLIGYTVREEVRIESEDVDLVEKLGKNIGRLVELGVITDYQRTEYFYTKLTDLRPELFAEATQDALKRAEAIVMGTGAKVGKVKSAKTGVIQVLAPNSLDIDGYGAYDLSTKEKEVTATVNVSFAVR